MTLHDYSRKLLHCGLEGARVGGEDFLHGRPLTPFLNQSARHAWKPAAIGAFIGVLGSYPGNGHRSASRVIAYGILGGAIGFGAVVVWENRRLAASIVSGAWKSIDKVRDEQWLDSNPIDYA